VNVLRVPFKAMGTPCELQLYAPRKSLARKAAALAIADVQRLEARYSRYREDSLLSAINRCAAVGGQLAVDDETAHLLDYAQTCYELSDGLFDITSGLLRKAWNFREPRMPEPALIASLLQCVGWEKLRWERPVLAFPEPGMEIDMGGMVKEYAADRAATLCQSAGIAHGMVNLGGDIRILGPHPDGSPWRVGIRHPRRQDALLQTVELREGALASSGDYERCIVLDGVRYGHVLNPRTGWPVRHLAAVTVLAPLCVLAGSACTIGMLKEEDGPQWLASLGLEHLWVDVAGRVGGTPGHLPQGSGVTL
jgi:thiamine biosynthesis lipoprotein